MDKRWFVLVTLLIVVGYFAVNSFMTANVVLNTEEYYNQGDKLSGVLSLEIKEGQSLEAKMPILVSLSKNDEVIISQTMTLDEFITLSGAKTEKVKEDGKEFYEAPGTYRVPISKIIDYTFKDKGEYELLFSVLDLDLVKITRAEIH